MCSLACLFYSSDQISSFLFPRRGQAYVYTIIFSEVFPWILVLPQPLDLKLDVNSNHQGVAKPSTLLSLGVNNLAAITFLILGYSSEQELL